MIIDDSKEREARLLGYVKKFDFPRLAGTKGERDAVVLTSNTFEELGYTKDQILKESFVFSTFYSAILIKIVIISNMIILFALLLFQFLRPFIIYGIVGIITLILISVLEDAREPELFKWWERNLGKIENATNVIATVPAEESNSENAGNIVISAHLDTKSQTFKTIWRVYFYLAWIIAQLILIITYFALIFDLLLLLGFELMFFEGLVIINTCFIFLVNFFLLIFKTKNKSHGALDNASGMAIVFELSSFFLKNPLKHFNIWFCQFSAEEQGTMGSRIFLDNWSNTFKNQNTFLFNFDMVSCLGHSKNRIEFIHTYGLVRKRKISPVMKFYLLKAALNHNLAIHGFSVITGAHTDSVPFHKRRFDAVDITTLAAAHYTHSKEDKWDKVDPTTLLHAYIIIKETMSMFDEDFKDLKKMHKINQEN